MLSPSANSNGVPSRRSGPSGPAGDAQPRRFFLSCRIFGCEHHL